MIGSADKTLTHKKEKANGTLLEASGLKKTYRQGPKPVEVIKGIDFSVGAGEFVVIVGPSGAGKSTLLSLLGGLDKPVSGSVRFQGKDLYRLPERSLAAVRSRSFGFVFQFYHLVPEMTALENVTLPGWIAAGGRLNRAAAASARELLEQVGLKDRLLHRPSELSGGEQQRVAIARALVNDPEIVFCDEPTGNLDSQTGAGILELLERFHQQKKTAFVVVTHEQTVARMAQRVLTLKDGRLWGGQSSHE
ncbi:MAG: ABC transporter ATP-binding protein [Candidatus Omnitrophica bacterium]|nr:ABC transporter ATP-binding protein [Candidatus Omnitrophota bacterium]